MSPTLSIATESLAVMLNIGYAYLLGREVRVGWVLGVVASVLGVWLYAVQDAWLMAALNVFYAVMGVYGWWNWGRATSDSGVSRYTLTKHVVALLLTGVGTACLVGLMHGAGMSGRSQQPSQRAAPPRAAACSTSTPERLAGGGGHRPASMKPTKAPLIGL